MTTRSTSDWPGERWDSALTADLDTWQPVHQILAELARRAGAPPISCPEDLRLFKVPLAAGLTLRQAFLHAAACSGNSVNVTGEKIILAAGPRPAMDTWVETMGGKIQRVDFDNLHGMIILPRKKIAGPIPWVWYAPSQGFQECNAWITQHLLKQNIAVAMMHVGESGGSPKGRQIFQNFYEHLVQHYDMAQRPVLWPQSRGGLMLYNWAAEHPESVRAVGGTYTVCNLHQWATATAPNIVHLYQLALEDFNLAAGELLAQMPRHNPIDRLPPLVSAGIPILHIHGDVDDVVPVETNAGELVKRYLALGGKAELIIAPGRRHEEVPEFFQSQPFVDFLIRHAKT